jgi:hypothetical protein
MVWGHRSPSGDWLLRTNWSVERARLSVAPRPGALPVGRANPTAACFSVARIWVVMKRRQCALAAPSRARACGRASPQEGAHRSAAWSRSRGRNGSAREEATSGARRGAETCTDGKDSANWINVEAVLPLRLFLPDAAAGHQFTAESTRRATGADHVPIMPVVGEAARTSDLLGLDP